MKIELDLPDNAENIRCFYEYKGDDGETVYAAKAIEGVRFHCVPAKEFDLMWKKDSANKDEREYENMLRKKIAETIQKIKEKELRCDLEFSYKKICPSKECACAKKFYGTGEPDGKEKA